MKDFNLTIDEKVFEKVMNNEYDILYQNVKVVPPILITDKEGDLVVYSQQMKELCDYIIKIIASNFDHKTIFESIKSDETNDADRQIGQLISEKFAPQQVPLNFIKLLCKYMLVCGYNTYAGTENKNKFNNNKPKQSQSKPKNTNKPQPTTKSTKTKPTKACKPY